MSVVPTSTKACSAPVVIFAPEMSVATRIFDISSGRSLNAMIAELAGVIPTKQTAMSAIGTNSCFVFMDWLVHVTFPKGVNASSAMIFLRFGDDTAQKQIARYPGGCRRRVKAVRQS